MLAALTIAWLTVDPDAEAANEGGPDADAELAEAPEEAIAEAQPDRREPRIGKTIDGKIIESLIRFDDTAIRIAADVLPGGQPEAVEAVVTITASLSHDFDSPVRDLEFGVALLPATELDFAWDRLHTPPLRLTTEAVERKMPFPLAVLTVPGDEIPLAAATPRDVSLVEPFDGLVLGHDGSATYLLALSGYSLDAPTERDILRILDQGGPADLSALARWAAATATEGELALADDARGRIMDAVEAEVRRLRAPPAFGDFQRLNAVTAVTLVCSRPTDIDRLLTLQRPMTILLSAAQVSYDTAASEEGQLGVSVHGFRRLQSPSDSAVAWENSLRRLRVAALDRLVRLAFDPLDFRDAPPGMRKRSVLNVQAAQLLQPLTTTSVSRVLALASDRPEMQQELLRFYVEVRHAAAVEPLVDWLLENPKYIDDLGIAAIDAFGDRLLPDIMRRFEEPNASMAERAATWRLLAALPERHAAQLAELSQVIGVEIPAPDPACTPSAACGAPKVSVILQAMRDHDERVQESRIEDLVHEIATPATTIPRMRTRLKAARGLAEADPSRAEAVADAIIAAHAEAARALDAEFPAERRAVLRQLADLPLASRHADAARTAVSIDAELAAARGEVDAALGMLEDFDPALDHAELRAQYLEIATHRWDQLASFRAWDEMDALLDRTEATLADDFEIETRRAELEHGRGAPLRIAVAVVAIVVFAGLALALKVYGVYAAVWRRIRSALAGMRTQATTHGDDASDEDAAEDAPSDEHDADADADADDLSVAAHDPVQGDVLGDGWSDGEQRGSPLDDFAA